MIVCPTPPQINDFCDFLGTPDAPVSKIASVKGQLISKCLFDVFNFLQKSHNSKIEFVCSFFGGNVGLKKSFQFLFDL